MKSPVSKKFKLHTYSILDIMAELYYQDEGNIKTEENINFGIKRVYCILDIIKKFFFINFKILRSLDILRRKMLVS